MVILDYKLAYEQVTEIAEEALDKVQVYEVLCKRQAELIAINELLTTRPTIH